jgi:hypothetical protein
VPEPGNPQELNRYSYVRNSPLRYTDPTGHFIQCDANGECYDDGYSISNPFFLSYNASERRKRLLAYNNALVKWAQKGWITDLEAFSQLTDFAASMIPEDIGIAGRQTVSRRTDWFVNDLTSILTGLDGLEFHGAAELLGQSGFAWIFQDPSTNAGGKQPHHIWAYVARAYRHGSMIASAGNLAHETFLEVPGGIGRSYQDLALGEVGSNLGSKLYFGRVKVDEVGDYFDNVRLDRCSTCEKCVSVVRVTE